MGVWCVFSLPLVQLAAGSWVLLKAGAVSPQMDGWAQQGPASGIAHRGGEAGPTGGVSQRGGKAFPTQAAEE